jgi:hypothetical protein
MEEEDVLLGSSNETFTGNIVEKRQQILQNRRNRAEFLAHLDDFSNNFEFDTDKTARSKDKERFDPIYSNRPLRNAGVLNDLPENDDQIATTDAKTEVIMTDQKQGKLIR